MKNLSESYNLAQKALADLKTAIHCVLSESNIGLSNVEIGRSLGIYQGHSGRHEGHISRVLLEIMQSEGLIIQDNKTKKWLLKTV